MELRVGKVAFKVWTLRGYNRKDGKRAKRRYAFDYDDGSKRKVCVRTRLKDLEADARRIAIKIINGENEANRLTPQDCRIHVAARELLDPFGLAIDAVARDVAEGRRIAPGMSHRELALFYKRNGADLAVEKKVRDVTAAVRADVLERGISGRFTRDIKNDTENIIDLWFGEHDIGAVQTEEILARIRAHQADRKFDWRRRNHIRDAFVYVWNYAKRMGWLPQDRDTAAQRVPVLKEPKIRRKKNVYTPKAMRAWISHIRPDALPWLLVCGFSTVRSEEVAPEPGANKDRLDWSDFKWDKQYGEPVPGFSGVGCIHVRAEVSKVNEDRYVPMPDNLIAWLLPFRDRTGPVYPGKYPPSKRETSRVGRATADNAGDKPKYPWKTNILRHTAITARLGVLKHRAQVAEEAGTSERRIRKNYNEGLDEHEAREIYDMFPDYSQKILPLWAATRGRSA